MRTTNDLADLMAAAAAQSQRRSAVAQPQNRADPAQALYGTQEASAPAAAAPAASGGTPTTAPSSLAEGFGSDWQSQLSGPMSRIEKDGWVLQTNGGQSVDANTGALTDASAPTSYSLWRAEDGGKTNYAYDANGALQGQYAGNQSFVEGLKSMAIPALAIAAAAFGIPGLTEGLSGAAPIGDAAVGAVGDGVTNIASGPLGSGSFGIGEVPGLGEAATTGPLGTGTYMVPGTTAGADAAGISAATDWTAATGGPAVGTLGAPTAGAAPAGGGMDWKSVQQGYQVGSLLAGLLGGGARTPDAGGFGQTLGSDQGAGRAGGSAGGNAVGGTSGTQPGVANTLLTTKEDDEQQGSAGGKSLLGG